MTDSFLSILTIVNFNLSNWILNLIVFLLIIISIKIAVAKNLLEAIISTSIFSLLIGLSYLIMDAPDVAMTEAALGACLSTCVYLSFLQKLLPDTKNNIQRTKVVPAIIICLVFVVILTYMGLELPSYGDANAPLQIYSSKYYIENTSADIGIVSIVAAILASYRGFDTLGETSVILIAGISVLLVFSLRKSEYPDDISAKYINKGDILGNYSIIKCITIFIVPFILLYSLYIQLNGESSPGGGFQAGVIFASSLIAYDLVCGNAKLKQYFSTDILIFTAVLGVMIYATIGMISLFFNENYLNYYSLANFTKDKLSAQHMGIFIVEIGIGLTISTIMYLIYNIFNYE